MSQKNILRRQHLKAMRQHVTVSNGMTTAIATFIYTPVYDSTFALCHLYVTYINKCHLNPCTNGGSCVDIVNGFQCRPTCASGYMGTDIQMGQISTNVIDINGATIANIEMKTGLHVSF